MTDPTKLYLRFESGGYAGLALNVNIEGEGEQATITFYDTNRGRIFRGSVTKEAEDGFSFQRTTGEKIEFRKATRALFDKYARPEIEGNVPAFRYEQDLHEWYRRRFL